MSTHSVIGIMQGDKIESIYSHWDGYLSYNGKVLQKYYDLEKTKQLMKLGSISSLGAEIGTKHSFDKKRKYNDDATLGMLVADECTAYGRDRGETDQESRIHNSIKEMDSYYDEGHYYIMMGDVWYYTTGGDISCGKELVLLSDAVNYCALKDAASFFLDIKQLTKHHCFAYFLGISKGTPGHSSPMYINCCI